MCTSTNTIINTHISQFDFFIVQIYFVRRKRTKIVFMNIIIRYSQLVENLLSIWCAQRLSSAIIYYTNIYYMKTKRIMVIGYTVLFRFSFKWAVLPAYRGLYILQFRHPKYNHLTTIILKPMKPIAPWLCAQYQWWERKGYNYSWIVFIVQHNHLKQEIATKI